MSGQVDSKLIHIHLDSDSLKEAWSSIGTPVESGAETALATIGATMSQVVTAGGAFFKFFGVADSFNETLKLWGYQPLGSKGEKELTKELSKKRSLGAKLFGTGVYAVHMTATALAATVILGGVAIFSPFITAAVSCTTFVKNVNELFRRQNDVRELEKDQSKLDKELKDANLNFEKNLSLYKDLQEARGDLHDLKNQDSVIGESLTLLDKLKKELDKPETAEDLQKLQDLSKLVDGAAEQYKSKLQGKIRKNYIIGMGEKNQHVPTAGILNQSRETLAKLQTKLEKAKKDKTDTSKIEEEMSKQNILITHFEKLQNLDNTIIELKQELKLLESGTPKEVTIKVDGKEEKVDLVALQKEYLSLRIEELEAKREHKKDPIARFEKVKSLIASHETIAANDENADPKERLIALEEKLRNALEAQKADIKTKINEKEDTLDKKQKYVALFTDDPSKGLAKSAIDLMKIAERNLDKKHELKLAKFERDKKIRHVTLAAGVAALSIVACVLWPIAATIATVMIGVGVVSLMSTIRDTWKKKNLEKDNKKEKVTELAKMKESIGIELSLDNTNTLSQTARLKAAATSLVDHTPNRDLSDVHLHTRSHTVHQQAVRPTVLESTPTSTPVTPKAVVSSNRLK
jgi:uncharacterized membrane protein HdeD (DUF308 family)